MTERTETCAGCVYDSPAGRMILRTSTKGLAQARFAQTTGAALAGEAAGFSQMRSAQVGPADAGRVPEKARYMLDEARRWLDAYFTGADPGAVPPLDLAGTNFQRLVWSALLEVPYGTTSTYRGLARRVGERRGTPTSARAVGGAVGRNPVLVIVPCHRIVGADGSLTGYAAGLDRKRRLLALEGVVL